MFDGFAIATKARNSSRARNRTGRKSSALRKPRKEKTLARHEQFAGLRIAQRFPTERVQLRCVWLDVAAAAGPAFPMPRPQRIHSEAIADLRIGEQAPVQSLPYSVAVIAQRPERFQIQSRFAPIRRDVRFAVRAVEAQIDLDISFRRASHTQI